ncbi:hypothetical protein FOCC_FOCC008310 [Frankliniella occidentalis]|nr:hypothetical protein FOCC_FOCC008310 [Frankliniella occidentalis]
MSRTHRERRGTLGDKELQKAMSPTCLNPHQGEVFRTKRCTPQDVYEEIRDNLELKGHGNYTTDDSRAELQSLAENLGFGWFSSLLVKYQWKRGIRDKTVQERLYADANISLEAALKLVNAAESSKARINSLQPPVDVHAMHYTRRKTVPPQQVLAPKPPPKPTPAPLSTTSQVFCFRCGEPGHTTKQCPRKYKDCVCSFCSKVGHLVKACKEKKKTKKKEKPNQMNSLNFNSTGPQFGQSAEGLQQPFYPYSFSIQGAPFLDISGGHSDLFSMSADRQVDPIYINLTINGKEVMWEIHQATVEVSFRGKLFHLPIMITPDQLGDAPNLFGRNWIAALYGEDFLEKMYQGLNLSIIIPGRYHLPYLLKWKKRLMPSLDPCGVEPTEVSWATALVPVPKKNGEIRLCADYKSTINPVLQPDTYTSPTVNEILAMASGCTVFAELDAKEAYLQIPLSQETSMLMVVKTKQGLFRPTTLQFGVKVAPGIFQRTMDGLLGKLKGVMVYQDNIYIFSSSFQQHENLEKLSKAGIRLNSPKCTWAASSICVLGYRIDKAGVHPTDEKIKAVADLAPPGNVQQLQFILGTIVFNSRFFKDHTNILEPLYRLLDKGRKWEWTKIHQKALDKVKSILTSKPMLVHYSLQHPIVLICDASMVGVGAVLKHLIVNADGSVSEFPVCYASRTMTPVERRYSQLDREALSLIFGVTHFHQYLYGRHFTLCTDHKPLVEIFKPGAPLPDHLSPRMVRWALKLGSLDLDLKYRPGKSMASADMLSRNPVSVAFVEDFEPVCIFLLDVKSPNYPLTSKDIALATKQDPTLSQVFQWIHRGWPDKSPSEEFKPYFRNTEAFSLLNDCILYDDRVVVPERLQAQALQLIHSDHFGVCYSKAMARSLVWWPGLDKEIAALVASCVICRKTAHRPPQSATSVWPLPTKPWERLHVDYAGPC